MNTKSLNVKSLTLALMLSANMTVAGEALANAPEINTCKATVCNPLGYLQARLMFLFNLF